MFTLPEPMPSDKEFSAVTQKIYKGRLNSLAKYNDSWNTVAALKKHSKDVCKYIDGLADDTEKGRLKKRGVLQAVFSVLDEKYRKTKNTFYKFWQKSAMPLTAKDGSDWKARADYSSSDSD